jgi:hypothetical protein
VVPRPSQSDLDTFNSVYLIPEGANLRDLAARRAFFVEQARVTATPAYQHGYKYMLWTFGRGPCVARSRHDLLLSGALLGAGATAITTALVVRRRRAVRLP